MTRLKPTDIPKDWLAEQYETVSVGTIANQIERGNSPVSDHLTGNVSRTVVARAMCLYDLFPDREKYKRESWLRSLYQDNTATETGEATIDDIVTIIQQSDDIENVTSGPVGRWLGIYNIPKESRTRDEIPRTDAFDREFFIDKYHEEGLTLRELTNVVNEKADDDLEISTNTVRKHMDWISVESRGQGNPQKELGPIENVDRYKLNHHYRVQDIGEAANADLEGSKRYRERWVDENDEVDHWGRIAPPTLSEVDVNENDKADHRVAKQLLPDDDILYDCAGLKPNHTPKIARKYDKYRGAEHPVRALAADIGIPVAVAELALVFYGVRDTLTFITIDDRSVVEDVPKDRSDLLTDRGAFAVLRFTFDMSLAEIAEYLGVCEGVVKFASRLHSIPVEKDVGRPSDGYRGELHDPRYLRQQLNRMGVSELAAAHNYDSEKTVQQLIDAFELSPPSQIPIPELGCSVRSNPEKHVGKMLAEIQQQRPELEIEHEGCRISIDTTAFDCEVDTKKYEPDFTVTAGTETLHIEVKGRVDNGVVHDHAITDRQKAKAFMEALNENRSEQYVVITNGADLEYYDHEFSFKDGFRPMDPFENHSQILENKSEFVSLLTPKLVD